MKLPDVGAIVTGAARGLGYAFSRELCSAGATVVAGDLNVSGLEALADACAGLPGRVFTQKVDVSIERSVSSFVEYAFDRTPAPNTLVNNAGVLLDGLLVAPREDWVQSLPLPQWRKSIDTNLTGAFLVARETAAAMLRREVAPGLIVNISSLSRSGNAGQSGYAASKAGLDAATRSWALELAEHGIRVAGIAPGVIDTPMIENVSGPAREELLSRIPVGRFGTPDEVWLALKFVIECDFFCGRVLAVDGGGSL